MTDWPDWKSEVATCSGHSNPLMKCYGFRTENSPLRIARTGMILIVMLSCRVDGIKEETIEKIYFIRSTAAIGKNT